MMSKSIFVLAIAGTSAAGKTTIVQRLLTEIPQAAALYFDDYEDENTYPQSFDVFPESNYDVNLFKSEKFAADIAALIAGKSITPPNNDTILEPPQVLILEEPTGRSRDIMNPLIDCAIWLDIPYDISLARRIIRTAGEIAEPEMQVRTIVSFTQAYLEFLGDIYKSIGEKVKSHSDVVIDASQPIDKIIETIKEHLKEDLKL